MALWDEPRDERLYELTVGAVRAANEYIHELEAANKYIGTHFHYPKYKLSEFGWPDISEMSNGPVDYSEPFGMTRAKEDSYSNRIAYRDMPAFAEYLDYVLSNESLLFYFNDGYKGDPDSKFNVISTALFALHILDRARHQGGADPSDELLRELYLDREPTLIEGELPVDLLIPILLVKFKADGRTRLAPGIELEELDEATHLSRAVTRLLYDEVNPFVTQIATHAIVMAGYHLNTEYEQVIRKPSYYPLDTIDGIFRAFDLVAPVDTGYAQLLLRPLGWAPKWSANPGSLIKAVKIRRYPPWFDDGAWRTPGSEYPSEHLAKVGKTIEALESASKSVQMAMRRLTSSTLRGRDDDTIIDLCIGLEAMFGERAAEVVHRLSLRVAAVVAASGRSELPAHDLFRAMKRIYDYRSRLVHGDDDAEQKRWFTASDGSEHDCLAVAGSLLRASIAAVLDRPELGEPGRVESDLLLGNLVIADTEET